MLVRGLARVFLEHEGEMALGSKAQERGDRIGGLVRITEQALRLPYFLLDDEVA